MDCAIGLFGDLNVGTQEQWHVQHHAPLPSQMCSHRAGATSSIVAGATTTGTAAHGDARGLIGRVGSRVTTQRGGPSQEEDLREVPAQAAEGTRAATGGELADPASCAEGQAQAWLRVALKPLASP